MVFIQYGETLISRVHERLYENQIISHSKIFVTWYEDSGMICWGYFEYNLNFALEIFVTNV